MVIQEITGQQKRQDLSSPRLFKLLSRPTGPPPARSRPETPNEKVPMLEYLVELLDGGQTVVLHEPDCTLPERGDGEVVRASFVRLGQVERYARFYGSPGCTVSACPECRPRW